MPAFFDTMCFGGQLLDLTKNSGSAVYAGGEYTEANNGVFAAVGGPKGIDLGSIMGNYKDRYHLRVLASEAVTGCEKVEVTLYSTSAESGKATAGDALMTLSIPVKSFNKCRQYPYEISLPPDVKRFNVIGFSPVSGTFTTGAALVTIEDKRW